MSSKAVIIQPPVLRELRVDSMLGTVETPKDQTTVPEFLALNAKRAQSHRVWHSVFYRKDVIQYVAILKDLVSCANTIAKSLIDAT